MPTLTENDSDQKYSPKAWDDKAGKHLSSAEEDALQGLEDNYATDADDSQENTNIEKARGAEAVPRAPSAAAKEKKNDKKTKDDKGAFHGDKSKLSTRERLGIGLAKRKGPLGVISAILLSTGGIFSALTTPGLALVQIKEALMEDLNDAVSAMDVRGQHIMRAKLKDQTKGFCTKSVSVRCKYKNMSNSQVKKLRKAGFTVESDRTTTGRHKNIRISYTDPATGEKKSVPPNEFKNEYYKNSHFRGMMNTAWNPKFSSIRDKAADKVKKRFKLSYDRLLNGKTADKMKRQYNKFVKEGVAEKNGRTYRVERRGDKKVYVDPETNQVLSNPDGSPVEVDDTESKIRKLKKASLSGGTRKKLATGVGAALAVSSIHQLGCEAIKALRIAGVVSRYAGFESYMRYVIPLFNTADSIKDGTATPEAVSFLGDALTHKDMREKTVDEDTLPISDNGDLLGAVAGTSVVAPTENKHKGEDAFDSAGLKASMYGESPNLDTREASMSLGSGVGNKFSGLSDKLVRWSQGLFDPNACSFWSSGWGKAVRITEMVLTVALIPFGGAGVAKIAGQAALGQGFALITGFITDYVASRVTDLSEGRAADGDTMGLDMGNAAFSGASAFSSATASSRGLNPLSTADEVQQSQQQAYATKQLYREVDQIAAQSTPFDIYNQYSFLGSIAWKINPMFINSTATVSSFLSTPLQLVTSLPGWLGTSAGAAVATDMSRYEKCDEEAYKQINMQSADFMCNIRWGVSDDQANSDPQKIVNWMIDSCQIDEDTGEINKTGKCPEGATRVADEDAEEISYEYGLDVKQVASMTRQELADRLINSTPAQVSLAMKYDDTPDNADIAAEYKRTGSNASLAADVRLPSSTNGGLGDAEIQYYKNGEDENNNVKDVRSYAHFMRYCRYGPDEGEGRNVGFGDADGIGKESAVNTGLDVGDDKYISLGKECLASNNCKPGENPNNADSDNSGNASSKAAAMCRPPQYDIYATYTVDASVQDGMDQEEENTDNSQDTSGLVTGEAKELARQVANNANIEFVNPATKTALLKFADTGEATNFCGNKFGIDPLLSGVLLTNAKKYKIKINNFGFKEDRTVACDNGEHPKGKAVDLNGIQKIGGGSAGDGAWGSINFSADQVPIITEYATDWMDALATKDDSVGRSGQLNCGGYNLIKVKKPNWKGVDGLLHFDDSCDHLHIDVGDRDIST